MTMRRTIFALFVTLMLVTPAFAQLQAPVGHNMVRMQDKFGHEVLVQMNQRTGSAHRVYGVLPNVTAYGYQPQNLDSSSIEGFSKKFFSDYSGILKINPDETRIIQLETNGKFWFVTYKQAINGVPIHGTQIGYTIDRTGDMIALGADAYQNVSVSTIPKIGSAQAIAAAEKAMSATSPKLRTPAALEVYPITSDSTATFRLTWKVTLTSFKPMRDITYYNYDQGSAMDEGLADYWACTYNNDPVEAEDCGVGRDLQNTDTYPTDYDSSPSADPHQNGLIVSGACWDMRQSIGATIASDLVFGALEMSPHAYNFDDFETNVITMDDESYEGNHLSQIQAAFNNHGISTPMLTVGVSGPSSLSTGQRGTWTVSASGGSGSYTYRWYLKSADPQTGGNWIGPLGSSTCFSTTMEGRDQYLYVRADVVSSDLYFGTRYKYVVCSDCNGGPLRPTMSAEMVGNSARSAGIPKTLVLGQNFPNPFNPTTEISFGVPKDEKVTLAVYDLLGRRVATLVNGEIGAGFHTVTWDASRLASGVYIYRITAGDYIQSRRMLLIK